MSKTPKICCFTNGELDRESGAYFVWIIETYGEKRSICLLPEGTINDPATCSSATLEYYIAVGDVQSITMRHAMQLLDGKQKEAAIKFIKLCGSRVPRLDQVKMSTKPKVRCFKRLRDNDDGCCGIWIMEADQAHRGIFLHGDRDSIDTPRYSLKELCQMTEKTGDWFTTEEIKPVEVLRLLNTRLSMQRDAITMFLHCGVTGVEC